MTGFPNIQVGELVSSRGIEMCVGSPKLNDLRFKFNTQKRDTYMVFLYLGTETDQDRLDASKRLNDIGWFRKDPIFHKPNDLVHVQGNYTYVNGIIRDPEGKDIGVQQLVDALNKANGYEEKKKTSTTTKQTPPGQKK